MTRELREQGKLVVLGVTQEQHPDRCRLFAQWQGIDWPILHDPINVLGLRAVPWPVAIDEHGVVRVVRARPEDFVTEFMNSTFEAPAVEARPARVGLTDASAAAPAPLKDGAGRGARVAFGESILLGGAAYRLGQSRDLLGEAIDAYGGIEDVANDASAQFSLGVALRMRYDTPFRRPGDFQAAIDAWQRALEIDPNHYIYRRRIQQYGPRLDKPYPFYDWVEAARAAVAARGETPAALGAEPVAAELARPTRRFAVSDLERGAGGDPGGKIQRDTKELIALETVVVRGTTDRGKVAAQVHLTFRPRPAARGHWNNEAEPLRVWLDEVEEGRLSSDYLEFDNPVSAATSDETRTLSFELALPPDPSASGSIRLSGYALYNTCEGKDGVCRFLRRDIQIEVPVE